MRMSRRMGLLGGGGYIWDVYTISQAEVLGAETSLENLSSTVKKNAASGFTYENGVFTLTDPVSTYAYALNTGRYILDVSTSSATGSQGETLYKVLQRAYARSVSASFSGSTTTTLSKTGDFIHGMEFGSRQSSNTYDPFIYYEGGLRFFSGSRYGALQPYGNSSRSMYGNNSDPTNYLNEFSTFTKLYKHATTKGSLDVVTSSANVSVSSFKWAFTYQQVTVENVRGDATGETVRSSNIEDYPEDGEQNGYWYVRRT